MDETIEVELVTDIIVEDDLNVTSDNNNDIEIIEEDSEFEVSVQKREYVITGDNMYIPLSYDESPQWLKDTINNITNFSLNQKLTEVDNLLSTLNNLIVELDIAKNTYTQSIISSADIDSRINAAITTLNSSMSNNDANIVNLIATKATPEEASAISLDVLSTSINNGQISSLVSNLQNAISTTNSSLSNNINTVHSEMIGEFEANATVIDSIQTYVGIDNAGASTSTGISAYIEGSDGIIGGADSKVVNNVYVDSLGNSKSKFEYNSIVNVGGIAYNSGFGLSNSSGTGIGSEFWINADKFKFTNSNATGSVTPFTIDASGTTPQIEFNGKVSFGNIYDQTIIQNGYINTGLIQANTISANQINTVGLIAENISANEIIGKIITGSTINGAVINGAVVKASYLDLDGQLEVLTNYHITPAMYNANPSLYTDAVYISGSNEYRIPSMSTVKESLKSGSLYNISSIYGSIWSYNTANSGTNLKAVKIVPTFLNTSSFGILTSQCGDGGVASTGTKNHVTIMLGNILLFSFKVEMIPHSSGNLWKTQSQFSGNYFTNFNVEHFTYTMTSTSNTYELNIGIGTLSVQYSFSAGSYTDVEGIGYEGPNIIKINCTLLSGEKTFPSNWTNGRLSINQVVEPYSYTNRNSTGYKSELGYTTYRIAQSLQINNMI